MPLRGRTKFKDYSCFFITTTCHEWLQLLCSEESFDLLYESLRFVNKKYKASIVAYVFMPNHIHLIVYFDEENFLSAYMRDFKKYTSTHLRKLIETKHHAGLLDSLRYTDEKGQQFKVWMDRFDDVMIRSTKVMLTKLNYIHANPVKSGLSASPESYKHSSAAYYELEKEPLIPLLHASELL